MMLRIVTWNVEWAEPATERGQIIMQVIESLNADVLVLTEGRADLLPSGGFVIDGGSDWGYEVQDPHRRKVIMWSRNRWISESGGSEAMPPGRFVSGRTMTPIGNLTVFGVCIPWRDAHVRTGQKNRTVWEDHLTYLHHLGPLIDQVGDSLVIAGDFNQRIPRGRAPHHVFESLTVTIKHLVVATDCVPDDPLIDHVVHSPDLKASSLEIIPFSRDRLRLTDHRGVLVDIVRSREEKVVN